MAQAIKEAQHELAQKGYANASIQVLILASAGYQTEEIRGIAREMQLVSNGRQPVNRTPRQLLREAGVKIVLPGFSAVGVWELIKVIIEAWRG